LLKLRGNCWQTMRSCATPGANWARSSFESALATSRDKSTLALAIGGLVRMYEVHLSLEEELVFPRTRELQGRHGESALASMGREMAERRGLRV